MKLMPRKRKWFTDDDVEQDRLSEMPDEVLVHILSFLPMLDAVRTVLLRRFSNLWTLVPNLTFDISTFLDKVTPNGDEDVGLFYIFVNNVLMLHKSPSIDNFHLNLITDWYNESIHAACGARMWLRFALDRQAKEINFCGTSDPEPLLPNFTSQFLITLELYNCTIHPQLQVNLGSLKKLVLNEIGLCDESFQHVLSGCPSLQELKIVNPCIEKLGFSAPNIHKLSLSLDVNSFFCLNHNPLVLNCPNLKSLELDTEELPVIDNVSSVRDVYIEGSLVDFRDDGKYTKLQMFLGEFKSAEVFRLSRSASWVFLDAIRNLRLSHNRWKRVVLELEKSDQDNLAGIYELTRSLKHLEELVIYSTEYLSGSTDLSREELSSPCVMPALKTVTLHGCVKPFDCHLQLVEFLLKSADVLEKVIIVPWKYRRVTVEEELEFTKRASVFYRSSPNASVVFA